MSGYVLQAIFCFYIMQMPIVGGGIGRLIGQFLFTIAGYRACLLVIIVGTIQIADYFAVLQQ